MLCDLRPALGGWWLAAAFHCPPFPSLPVPSLVGRAPCPARPGPAWLPGCLTACSLCDAFLLSAASVQCSAVQVSCDDQARAGRGRPQPVACVSGGPVNIHPPAPGPPVLPGPAQPGPSWQRACQYVDLNEEERRYNDEELAGQQQPATASRPRRGRAGPGG